MIRVLRNVALVTFALLAFATTAEVGVRAYDCSDVRDLAECTSCGQIGVCYSFSDNCAEYTGCGGGTGPSPMCDWEAPNPPQNGEDIWFCECDDCG